MSLVRKFFPCDQCKMVFHTLKELTEHKQRTHNFSFLCPICGRIFKGEDDLLSHLKKVHFGEKLSCPVCALSFYNQYNLGRHFLLIHCSVTKVECGKCKTLFKRKYDLKVHEKKCLHENVPHFTCKACGKTFLKKSNCTRHELNHEKSPKESDKGQGKTFQCNRCGKKLKGAVKFDQHKATCKKESHSKHSSQPSEQEQFSSQLNCQRSETDKRESGESPSDGFKRSLEEDQSNESNKKQKKVKTICCHKCGEFLSDYKALYRHKMMEHRQVGGAILKKSPWESTGELPPWQNHEETEQYNKKLEAVYNLHRSLILKGDSHETMQSVYNFPVDNSVTLEDLMSQAEEIYRTQSNSYKINLSVGIILYNIETHEFRYFKPYDSHFMLNQPISISSRAGLDLLRRTLSAVDLTDYLFAQRPDTKFKPILVTNIRWIVSNTGFPLGAPVTLPNYISNKKSIWCLSSNPKTGEMYTDNLCIFRCFIAHKKRSQYIKKSELKECWHVFRHYMYKTTGDQKWARMYLEEFEGVELSDIVDFEMCFQVNINIFELLETDITQSVYRSRCHYKNDDGQLNTMNLNLFQNHLSYVKNMSAYAKRYECSLCQKLFTKYNRCLIHHRTCKNATVYKFPGKFHKMNNDIFERLLQYGIDLGCSNRFFNNFIVFDYEAYLEPMHVMAGEKLMITHKHHPVSVAVCSNVEGFENPQCFINSNPKILVKEMLNYMMEIQECSEKLCQEEWGSICIQLENKAKYWKNLAETTNVQGNKIMYKNIEKLKMDFASYCKQIPVLGFNSAKYDINLILPLIVGELIEEDANDSPFVIKKNNSYCCFANTMFKFLDISHYLAPGFSYSSFLKCFQIEEKKFFFPYEWFDCSEKLEHDELPDYECFYSQLKGGNTLDLEYQSFLENGQIGEKPQNGEENYKMLQEVWNREDMKTFADFLSYYNILDVKPFVKAVEKLQSFYKAKNIDIFKTAISIPGIARKMLFQSSMEKGFHFALIDEQNKDLYQTFNSNIVGGPSLIFLRKETKNETKIRGNLPCQKIIGYDCNSLYLSAMSGYMPIGPFIRRKKQNKFQPEKRDSYLDMFYWMDFLSLTNGMQICHFLNSNREFRVSSYLVDGICGKNVYEYYGCFYHKHECNLTKTAQSKTNWQCEKEKKNKYDKERLDFIESQGYNVSVIWECEFNQLKKSSPKLREFIKSRQPPFFLQHRKEVEEHDILEAVLEDKLFGVVECDISVPKDWHMIKPNGTDLDPFNYFQEYCPLFCNVNVPFEVIGEHMQNFVIENNLSQRPRRLLVSGLKAEKILLCTELLKWYLEHGLIVTQIYQVIEYAKAKCFKSFTSTVTEARREGDRNPHTKLLADSYKLLGNSAFGGLLLNKEKHRKVCFVHGQRDALKKTNSPQFREMDILDKELYEIQMAKKKICMDLPIQLGFFILQLAKLRMLQFYYDFMDVYFDRSHWEMIMTDTDSAYFGITSENLSELVKENKKMEFNRYLKGFCHVKEVTPDTHFLPRECCSFHNKYDQRTPGLFKEEFRGDRLIALASKTYALHCDQKKQTKISCKGVNKSHLQNPMHFFENVLEQGENQEVENRGLRSMNRQMFSYKQNKTGFSYFYCKREVLADGIHTVPLDIVLKPYDSKED